MINGTEVGGVCFPCSAPINNGPCTPRSGSSAGFAIALVVVVSEGAAVGGGFYMLFFDIGEWGTATVLAQRRSGEVSVGAERVEFAPPTLYESRFLWGTQTLKWRRR